MCNRCKINSSPKAFLVQLKSVHVAPVGFPNGALALHPQSVSFSSQLLSGYQSVSCAAFGGSFSANKLSRRFRELFETFANVFLMKIMPLVLQELIKEVMVSLCANFFTILLRFNISSQFFSCCSLFQLFNKLLHWLNLKV